MLPVAQDSPNRSPPADATVVGQPAADPVAPAAEPADTEISGWFIAACIVLPVVWGILVHWVFQRLRRNRPRTRTDRADHEPSWPDYQI